ncbi:MAG TPA: ABC transporter ATP-binding protein [Myxococcota bacterium]|nr:ABC transporter ATP-binding protein [Myxococcota bacterium]
MIEAVDLVKRYGDVQAVAGISFKVGHGEALALLGPNGAGKTTTLRILAGNLSATSGKAIVAGYDVFEQPIEVKRRTGFMPEAPPLYDELSVSAFLSFIGHLKELPRGQLAAELRRVLSICGLTEVRKRRIGNLSKGYRQRIGLAQALLADPQVLILDEPTIGLDPNQIADVRSLITKIAADHTVILSTHVLGEVLQICDRALIIHHGRIMLDDRLDQITADHGSLEDAFRQATRE